MLTSTVSQIKQKTPLSHSDTRRSELPRPKIEESVDENGIVTTVEYAINDEGKKVKARFDTRICASHQSLTQINCETCQTEYRSQNALSARCKRQS